MSLLLGLALALTPGTSQAAPPKDIPVVVHPVECVRWRCGAGFRDALTDRVTSALTRGRKFKPVDRANLKKALGEQLECRKGIRKGIISRECLIQAGRVMQARKMITGRLVKIGTKNNYQLTLGITDLATVKNERSVSQDCWGCGQRALLQLADRTTDLLTGVSKGGRKTPPRPAGGGGGETKLPPATPELGNLRVEGSPRGARVEVQGPKGFKGPKAARLPRTWTNVPAGTYHVKVQAPDREPYETRVQVAPGRTKMVTVDLVHAFGKLTVGGKPPGARVVVTGAGGYSKKWKLTVGDTIKRVRRGSYTVVVSHSGYTTFQQQVTVAGGKEARVAVKLAQVESAAPGVSTKKGKAGLVWVSIPGGRFMMGSNKGESDERPKHRVSVKAFQLNRTEVTVSQYRACVKARQCMKPNTGTYCNWKKQGRGKHPVNCVDWSQARAFCRWAGGRLPSEAEWEYAARGGGKNIQYPWGNQKATCTRAVMDDGSGNGCGKDRTWPVCSRTAGNTAQGLCDMAGNVFEWVEDRSHRSYKGARVDGRAWTVGSSKFRVLRGGSWDYSAGYVRATYRYSITPTVRIYDFGFRCAMTGP